MSRHWSWWCGCSQSLFINSRTVCHAVHLLLGATHEGGPGVACRCFAALRCRSGRSWRSVRSARSCGGSNASGGDRRGAGRWDGGRRGRAAHGSRASPAAPAVPANAWEASFLPAAALLLKPLIGWEGSFPANIQSLPRVSSCCRACSWSAVARRRPAAHRGCCAPLHTLPSPPPTSWCRRARRGQQRQQAQQAQQPRAPMRARRA